MLATHKIALALHTLVAVGYLGLGSVYYSTTQVMPYHEVAMGQSWESIPEATKVVILSFMKGGGAACVGMSVMMLVTLMIPFRRGERWARIVVPSAAIAATSLFLVPIAQIVATTDAKPPWQVIVGGLLLSITGLLLTELRPR